MASPPAPTGPTALGEQQEAPHRAKGTRQQAGPWSPPGCLQGGQLPSLRLLARSTTTAPGEVHSLLQEALNGSRVWGDHPSEQRATHVTASGRGASRGESTGPLRLTNRGDKVRPCTLHPGCQSLYKSLIHIRDVYPILAQEADM